MLFAKISDQTRQSKHDLPTVLFLCKLWVPCACACVQTLERSRSEVVPSTGRPLFLQSLGWLCAQSYSLRINASIYLSSNHVVSRDQELLVFSPLTMSGGEAEMGYNGRVTAM